MRCAALCLGCVPADGQSATPLQQQYVRYVRHSTRQRRRLQKLSTQVHCTTWRSASSHSHSHGHGQRSNHVPMPARTGFRHRCPFTADVMLVMTAAMTVGDDETPHLATAPAVGVRRALHLQISSRYISSLDTYGRYPCSLDSAPADPPVAQIRAGRFLSSLLISLVILSTCGPP